jgi:hypothetical protein
MSFSRSFVTVTVTCLAAAATALTLAAAAPDAAMPLPVAAPVCASASTTGLVTADINPVCVPTGLSTVCVEQRAGLDPTLLVTVELCLPGV